MLIRRGAPFDIEILVELAAEYCAADGHDFDETTVRRGFLPVLVDDHHGVVWVACDEATGAIDGYAVVTWGWSIEVGGLDVVIDEIYVRHQGRGTGGALLERLEADCRDRGVCRIFLETELPNDGARRLYARHGFEADDSIWMEKVLR